MFGGFGPQNAEDEEEEEEEDEEEENQQETNQDEEMEDAPATFGWFNDLHTLDTST